MNLVGSNGYNISQVCSKIISQKREQSNFEIQAFEHNFSIKRNAVVHQRLMEAFANLLTIVREE